MTTEFPLRRCRAKHLDRSTAICLQQGTFASADSAAHAALRELEYSRHQLNGALRDCGWCVCVRRHYCAKLARPRREATLAPRPAQSAVPAFGAINALAEGRS